MKNPITFIVLLALSFSLNAQTVSSYGSSDDRNASITVGFMNGGGGLIGADFEFLLSDKIGLQAGIGFVSYGFGLNYHLKDGGIGSSFINLGYWHQGIGDTYAQSILGPSYVFRARKLLQLQIGFGAQLGTGPAYNIDPIPVMLLYSAGLYFPIR